MSLQLADIVAKVFLHVAGKLSPGNFGLLQQYLPKAAVSNRSKASPYSTTSSARSRIDVGNTIPNLFAVLTLTTSSNFVGNSAGTSLGFEPRNTLATIGAPLTKEVYRIYAICHQSAASSKIWKYCHGR
jgi:hypothetical protein